MASLIEFEDIEFATQAKDFLNNTKFFTNTMKIFYSNYPTINVRKINPQTEEVYLVEAEKNRFKQGSQPYSINPPS